MSNLTTLPKGDSAWLLRKSIQRIIQQVSVLETNIGSSTTGNSSNTQIIFNDAGTLRGDSGLTYNKTTDVLSVGAATITGALTAAGNSVIGTGSAQNAAAGRGNLTIGGTGTAILNLSINSADTGYVIHDGTNISLVNRIAAGSLIFWTNSSTRYQIASDGVATWSNVGGVAGTAMTLNSTGLGLGVSPVTALSFPIGTNKVVGQSATSSHAAGNVGSLKFGIADGGGDYSGIQIFNTHNGTYSSQDIRFFTGEGGVSVCTERMRITPSGNVGIGVTPSAWASGLKALQGANTGSYWFGGGTAWSANNYNYFGNNGYNDGTNWLYTRAYGAAQYEQYDNEHRWKVSTNSPSAGGTITFLQAMTLDASGNLLVGKTAIGTTVGVEVRPDGYIIATRSASTDAAAFTNAVYSTGASAYRFYVGLGGTVYATNTTISAISDQRLKENVQDIDVGLGAILALKPRKFDWKDGKGKNIKGDRGFIAQEFEQVFPQLVDQWADEAPEGEAPYKSVRQDLIPVLVKAIQELTARVQTLETR